MPTYIIYSRCSTDEQRRRDNSHPYQIRGIQDSQKVKGWECKGIYSDTISGRGFIRPELEKAYEYCKAAPVDYLLIYRFDRFGRNTREALNYIEKFRQIGVEINCPDEWLDMDDDTSALLLPLRLSLAEIESRKISDRTKNGIHQTLVSGLWPFHAPPGYVKTSTGKNARGKDIKVCIPDPDKAPLIRGMFEKFASGNYLKSELFKEYGEKVGVRISAFEQLFSNQFYTGNIYVPPTKDQPGYWNTGKHQPLIDLATFIRMQEIAEGRQTIKAGTILKDPKKTNTELFYLKGLLKCDITGGTMTAYQTTKKRSGQAFFYYQTAKSDTRQIIPVAKAHEAVRKAVSEFVISDEYKDAIVNQIKKEIQAKEAQREKDLKQLGKEAEQSRARIMNLKMSLADGNITGEEYREVKQVIETKLAETNAAIRELETQGNEVNETLLRIVDSLTRLDFLYSNATPERKRELLQVVFPEGFSIDKASGKVRTGVINVYLLTMCEKSGSYEHIINGKGEAFTAPPVMGGYMEKVRTEKHLYLIKKIA